MELLAALGFGASGLKEVFNYNRENFKFDQDQRLEREGLRLEMQVKRFELFREDVRDLVDLTVDRMDVYHLVGALFLEFCVVLFCEGRVQASAPPFLLSLFLLSNACAFIYLLLAVWLSMHASIASHSFGVRLLTRFVRLPIPSVKQITSLRSQLRDYEKQGVANLLRLPFQDKQDWHNVNEEAELQKQKEADAASSTAAPSSSSFGQSSSFLGRPAPAPQGGDAASSASAGAVASSSRSPRPPQSLAPPPSTIGRSRSPSVPKKEVQIQRPSPLGGDEQLLPEEMDLPLGGEDLLLGHKGARPERHVQLFRQLQSKWQCYDAYCRVCMGLGVNQILQALSYYCICHTLVENHSPTTGYALVFMLQCTTVAIAVLDLAGMKRHEIVAVQVVGIMPCFLSAWGVAHGHRDEGGVLDPEQDYVLSPMIFLSQVLWLELWLRIAAPSGFDLAKLPRRFRQVLFLDVFGDSQGWDPTQAENNEVPGQMLEGAVNMGNYDSDDDEEAADDETVGGALEQATSQLSLAQSAVRRWKAAPEWTFSAAQRKELEQLSEKLKTWGHTIKSEVERRDAKRGLAISSVVFETDLRRWSSLSAQEKLADPFAKCLLGPFEHDMGYSTSCFHYDIEGGQTLFEDTVSKVCPGELVLTLEAVAAVVKDLERDARALLETRITADLRDAMRRQALAAKASRRRRNSSSWSGGEGQDSQTNNPAPRDRRHSQSQPARMQTFREKFPNVVSLFNKSKKQGGLPPKSLSRPGGSRRRRAEDRHGLLAPGAPEQSGTLPEAPLPRGFASAPSLMKAEQEEKEPMSPGKRPVEVLSPKQAVPMPEASRQVPDDAAGALPGAMPPVSPTSPQDLTLVAMAGQHARHFVPERLPWLILSRMTRVLQLCWLWSGLMTFLKEAHIYQVDYQQHPGGERRRLAATVPWGFEDVSIQWPHGEFFRPSSMFCFPGMDAGIAVASPFAVYAVNMTRSPSFLVEEIRKTRMPMSTVALCPAAVPPSVAATRQVFESCHLAAPVLEGVRIWSAAEQASGGLSSMVLPVDGERWSLLAGGVLPCARVEALLPTENRQAESCLLLAGWDGQMLPVAVVPLPRGSGHLPAEGARVQPSLDVPLPRADLSRGIAALHLEPQQGRLWAIIAGGELVAWDLLEGKHLGRWRPSRPRGVSPIFQPVALCEHPIHGLLAAGRGVDEGALLLRASLPPGLPSTEDAQILEARAKQ